jgi:hypothetical protein
VSTNLPLWWIGEVSGSWWQPSLCGNLNGDVAFLVKVNFGKQIACLHCLLVFFIFTLTLELTFESIYFGVLLLLISFVAGCFHINYTKFGSFTICKCIYFASYCVSPLRAGWSGTSARVTRTPGHPVSRAGSSGPWSAATILQIFKVILFTPPSRHDKILSICIKA